MGSAACARGEKAAWTEFVGQYGPWMASLAKRYLRGDESLAEDVVAEIFRQFLEKDRALLKSFGEPYNLSAWLTVLVRRTASRLRRRNVAGFEPEVAFLKTYKRPAVEKFLARLPGVDGRILKLYYLDGRSYEEISQEIGIPVNSIGKRKTRALAALRGVCRLSSAFSP